jgi:Na+-driven multidrug efflux pump
MMGMSGPAARGVIAPITVALAITLAFFFLTGYWTNLGNPIASIASVLAGVAGFGVGAIPLLRKPRPKAVTVEAPDDLPR